MRLRKGLYLGLAGLMVAGIGATASSSVSHVNAKRISRRAKVTKQRVRNHKPAVRKPSTKARKGTPKVVDPRKAMRTPISYRKSSETIPYPKRLSARKDHIVVSLKNQRAYLMRGKKLLYEFYVSTGKNVRGRRTPKGHYRINGYRAPWFYSAGEREGARYAVGWKDWGLYLFHETPSNSRREIIKSIAKDLGKKGSSYGCVHLSVSDAKWFYSHAPVGMRVIIR